MRKFLMFLMGAMFVGVLGVGIYQFNNMMNKTESGINKTKVVQTYAENQRQIAKAKANAKEPTVKEIAAQYMDKSTGVAGSKKGYSQFGVTSNDKFIKYGVLSGDGIPYSSTMKNSNQNLSLSQFDIMDKEYWNNIKNKDFTNARDKVNKELPELTSKDNQMKEIQQTIKKAQEDEKKNNQELIEQQKKNAKPQDVK